MLAVSRLFLYLVFYSFAGWVWESVFCSLWFEHRFINRGFLNGPYCPIYGCGAVLDILLLGSIRQPVALFFASGILCCALEYATSVAMEKLFHARWWDYSDQPCNLQGRVCLLGFVAFGGFSTALLLLIHPVVSGWAALLSDTATFAAAGVLLVLIGVDIAVTVAGIGTFRAHMRELAAALERVREDVSTAAADLNDRAHARAEAAASHLTERASAGADAIAAVYSRFAERVTAQQKRLLRAFPQLRPAKGEAILRELRRFLFRRKDGE